MSYKDPVVWLVIAGIYAGLLSVSAILFSIIWDLIAVTRGWLTVSAFVSGAVAPKHPYWPIVLTGALCFAIGCLVGHLFMTER